MSWFETPEGVFFAVAMTAMIVVFLMGCYHALCFYTARERQPLALRNAELDALVPRREAELLDSEQRLADVNDRIREGEAKLSERDRWEAEAEFWRSQVEGIKAEHAGMDGLRAEIEEVQERYRLELEKLADTEQKAREAKGAWEDARLRVVEAERRLAQIGEEEGHLSEKLDAVRRDLAEAEAGLAASKAELRTAREGVERAHERADGLTREAEILESRSRELREAIPGQEKELNRLRAALDDLVPKREELEQVRQALSLESGTRDGLRKSISELQEEEALLNARIAQKRANEEGLTNGDPFKDLRSPPGCLAGSALMKPLGEETEADALGRVRRHLEDSNLDFHRRTVDAFHTSLKTGAISPLTVLAGVSGTGKSQLPRLYAEAMGMHFLKLAVQPRWDGPQDLLGFYNYIEQRYKGTEFARALVHMDIHNWEKEANPYRDRMLLVLLDEMNLARVEYYFSEFLSRLEGRPADGREGGEASRRPAEIPLETAGRDSNADQGRVYVGHNILFVGTMNDDESTLSLSNKVLDRSNVMHFPRPAKLKPRLPAESKHMADGYLQRARWTDRWMRSIEDLEWDTCQRAEETVNSLSDIMDDMDRPFGHRMSQAILHYVANYPRAGDAYDAANRALADRAANRALADQVEFRLLPRLRGVDRQVGTKPLNELAAVVGDRLGDRVLAKAIEETASRVGADGLFVWRGLVRH